MFWVFLEIFIALGIAGFIVWWTMPRPRKRLDEEAKDKNA